MNPLSVRFAARIQSTGTLFLLAAALGLATVVPDTLQAQLVTGRFTTSLYTWEKFDAENSSATYLRGFQNVQLTIAQGDVSFNTYMQGAIMSDGGAGLVRAYNMYLRWANIAQALDLTLGRQAIFGGVGYGTIDGMGAKLRLFKNRLTVAGYGGATPEGDYRGVSKSVKDNMSFGGQITTTAIPNTQLGLSYMNRRAQRDPYWTTRMRDTSFTPVPYQVTFEPESEELIGGDAYYTMTGVFSAYGRYDHDLANNRVSRAQVGVRASITPRLGVTLESITRTPRISYNSIFTAFVPNSTQEVEAGVEYEFLSWLRAYGRVANVQVTDESGTRWTFGVNSGYGSVSYSGSSGYVGQLQSVSMYGNYPLLENRVIPQAGIVFSSYRFSEQDDRATALAVVLGGTWRPIRSFSLDVQGQWLTNEIYSRDLRGMLKLNYWFAERLSLFGQEAQ